MKLKLSYQKQGQEFMARIDIPTSIEAAPKAAQPMLEAVKKQLGTVPNLFRLMANSPQTLRGYLGFDGAMSSGTLSPELREGVALAVSQINGCEYCLAAHTYFGKKVSKLSDEEIVANRNGTAGNPKTAAAIRFATTVTHARGGVKETDIATVKAAGFSDAEVVELVGLVALNTFSNYINIAFRTDVDFPAVNVSLVD
jgi:uncharacterized peroxidase-related enzyme